jgi:hypothetical protein
VSGAPLPNKTGHSGRNDPAAHNEPFKNGPPSDDADFPVVDLDLVDHGPDVGPAEWRLAGQDVRSHAGTLKHIPFKMPFQLAEDVVKVELAPYPHREFHGKNEAGEAVRYVPAMSVSLSGIIQEPALQKLEVLYVGQAFAEGKRTALDRLRSHSTLQRILAEMQYEMPDDEVLLLAFEYVPYRVISFLDGIDQKAIRDDRDHARFISLLDNPLTKAQQISLVEAGLIRHFKPRYNVVYKDSFPASDQALLNSCYELDFSALVVEIDTEELGLPLYSGSVAPGIHHLAKFDPFDPTARRSFFTFVDKDGKAVEMPGVVPPTG